MKKKANVQFKSIFKFKNRNFIIVKINNKYKKFLINNEIKQYIPNLLIAIAVLSNYFNISKIKSNIFSDLKLIEECHIN